RKERLFPLARKRTMTMIDHTVEETVVELRRIFKEDLSGPFPYGDCRRLRAKAGGIYEGLIPDLDLYFWDVAKYCSLGKKLLRLPKDDLIKARDARKIVLREASRILAACRFDFRDRYPNAAR
ncbi:MAG: hypothetical protein ACREEM_10950, partial [Blastocatellia bacterium]